MSITLGVVTLPGDLRWADEFAWSPVVQSAEYSLTGALIVQTATRLAGRPITLEAQRDTWVTRDTVLAVQALADTPGWVGVLTLHDGRVFTVAFRDERVSAEPVRHIAPHEDADAYTLTLQLQTI
jgi:hypothetical protein